MPVVCEGCGQPVACVNCLQLCMICVLTSERRARGRGAGAGGGGAGDAVLPGA